jgi:pimeloyl-ACP methyl ester carboxylesterase
MIKFLSLFLPFFMFAEVSKAGIYYETFGKKEDPAYLLIMGAAGQCLLWPKDFCEKLSAQGFFVIRFDQRDSGKSFYVDYKLNPYHLSDLAADAISVLDDLEIEKAHFFGLSMGGPISEFAAVKYPERVLSLATFGSHFDYQPMINSFSPLQKETSFSAPTKEYQRLRNEIMQKPALSFEEQVEQRLQIWQLINGFDHPLDYAFIKPIAEEYSLRTENFINLDNYRLAIINSNAELVEIHHKVGVPALIFQGTSDPILGIDHAEALSRTIPQSSLHIVKGMGHLINPHFYSFIIEKLNEHAKDLN